MTPQSRPVVIAFLTSLVLAAAPGVAAARLVRISGASPLPRSCEVLRDAQRGSEVEPTIAVNPANPLAMAAAWQQDRYRSAGAAALGVAFSRDGGSTWARAHVPGISDCAGRRGRNSDPWLSAGPDGTFYLTSIPGTIGRRLMTRVVVNVSRDGGATWSAPVALAGPAGPFNDKESVTADPTRPGYAYVVWSQLDRILMSRTTDSGRAWSAPTAIATGRGLNISTITVLPDGTLAHAFFRSGRTTESLEVARSADAGVTWSAPVRVGTVRDATAFDPGTFTSVRGAPIAAPGVVAGPRGEAYAGWLSAGRRGAVRVLVARSLDGGRTWSRARAPLPSRTKAFAPALAVSPDGTVGLTAYRLLAGGRADVVSARSRDGVSWAVARLTPRFSLRRSPRAGVAQSFIGDYTGLAARPGGFAAALSLGPPAARRGAADVFVASFAALP